MTDKQPIDYARADADVVRKKFRRRVVMFVIATVVVMGIGGGWVHSSFGGAWSIGDFGFGTPCFVSIDGWIALLGPERTQHLTVDWYLVRSVGNDQVGLNASQWNRVGYAKWDIGVRYRTLFILAMIPWIITLIRMIRIWKRNRAFETEPRTE